MSPSIHASEWSRFVTLFLTFVAFFLVGCGADQGVPFDANAKFADVVKQLDEMTATLKSIPDQYKIVTPRDQAKVRGELEGIAKTLREQADTYDRMWAEISRSRHSASEFQPEWADRCAKSLQSFRMESERIRSKNPTAFQFISTSVSQIENSASA